MLLVTFHVTQEIHFQSPETTTAVTMATTKATSLMTLALITVRTTKDDEYYIKSSA